MTDDPFLTLVVEALNLMHPRFAAANGREYTPEEAAGPLAARKVRERPFLLEFYHEVRHLWDQAVPVQLGLGHVVVQSEPDLSARIPDLLFWQLGERGEPDRRLAAVSLALLTNPDAVSADQTLLARYRHAPGYRYGVGIVVGGLEALPAAGMPAAEGVTAVFFDAERWQARVIG
jgi:hypothetical protein